MIEDFQAAVSQLISNQTTNWELAKSNYAQLKKVVSREVTLEEGVKFIIQHNPERIRSSAAKVDPQSILERKCFLCTAHLPEEQESIDFRDNYLILVNPFPIFKEHLTIPSKDHTDQRIKSRFKEMLLLSKALKNYVVFYNGPKCGASAPDHFHFQAGSKGLLPIEGEFESVNKTILASKQNCRYYTMNNYIRKTIVITGNNIDQLIEWFEETMVVLGKYIPSDPEPMMNIIAMWVKEEWRIFIFPRKKHRPNQYFMEGESQILLSPASVDFGGVLITPREEDFNKLDGSLIRNILEQVTIENETWEKVKNHFKK